MSRPTSSGCQACRTDSPLGFDFSMAFQPIDDFGAGHSGLNLLAEFQPDIIKIDMALIRDIHLHRPRQAIVAGALAICRDLAITVVAEGIESQDEANYLRDAGVRYMQGYWFAKPAFQALPPLSAAASTFAPA